MPYNNRAPSRTAGCYFWPSGVGYYGVWKQLPMVECKAKTVIKGSASRTRLKQYFTNVDDADIEKCQYAFPLYDGVSVVGFKCQIGGKILEGIVKEREEAKQEFNAAVAKGESAGLMEQNLSASDVFSTSLGNIPKGSTAVVTIEYIHELQHDLETDSLKFEMPTGIAPRYGSTNDFPHSSVEPRGFEWICDINSPSPITKVDSPTHSVSVTLGQLSTENENDDPDFKKCSVKMSLQKETGLSKELILTVKSKGIKDPVALWETHPTVKNHSALMTTLVPNFALPQIKPEVVFVCDRSGSMGGEPIQTLVEALRVMLHSLPANGIKFNICSFGSGYQFLFNKSETYSKTTLQQATHALDSFDADFGGTETEQAVRATIEQRWGDIPLEIILLTDGDIWNQSSMFSYLNEKVAESNQQIRVFPLGIGHGVSSALIEGLARAGNGFASTVMPGERMDQRCMRMLKAALSPHITDYKLEVQYEKEAEDDFEIVESVDAINATALHPKPQPKEKKTISLFDTSATADDTEMADANANMPKLSTPSVLQAPFTIPPLYAFSRTTVYLLLGPESAQRTPKTVILKGTLDGSELKLEIPVIDTGRFRTIHQLAARRAVQDLEEGRGWPFAAKTEDGTSIKEAHPSSFEDVVKGEAVRIGTTFQVMNRWCSYVARERAAHDKDATKGRKDAEQAATYHTRTNKELEEESSDDDSGGDVGFGDMGDAPAPAPAPAAIPPPPQGAAFGAAAAASASHAMPAYRTGSMAPRRVGSPSPPSYISPVPVPVRVSATSLFHAPPTPATGFNSAAPSPFAVAPSQSLFGSAGPATPPSAPSGREFPMSAGTSSASQAQMQARMANGGFGTIASSASRSDAPSQPQPPLPQTFFGNPATPSMIHQTRQLQAQSQSQSAGAFNSQAGLFGSSQAQNLPQAAGLFGTKQAQSTPPAGGLFGARGGWDTSSSWRSYGSSQAPNAPPPPAGELFGSKKQSHVTPPPPAAGLFGLDASRDTGAGGLFGSNSSRHNPPASGLFGSNSSQHNPPATGLFGSNQAQNTPPTAGLFGSNQAQTTSPATGLFGSSASQNIGSGGLFGSNSSQNDPPATGLSASGQSQHQPPPPPPTGFRAPNPFSQEGSTPSSSLFATGAMPVAAFAGVSRRSDGQPESRDRDRDHDQDQDSEVPAAAAAASASASVSASSQDQSKSSGFYPIEEESDGGDLDISADIQAGDVLEQFSFDAFINDGANDEWGMISALKKSKKGMKKKKRKSSYALPVTEPTDVPEVLEVPDVSRSLNPAPAPAPIPSAVDEDEMADLNYERNYEAAMAIPDFKRTSKKNKNKGRKHPAGLSAANQASEFLGDGQAQAQAPPPYHPALPNFTADPHNLGPPERFDFDAFISDDGKSAMTAPTGPNPEVLETRPSGSGSAAHKLDLDEITRDPDAPAATGGRGPLRDEEKELDLLLSKPLDELMRDPGTSASASTLSATINAAAKDEIVDKETDKSHGSLGHDALMIAPIDDDDEWTASASSKKSKKKSKKRTAQREEPSKDEHTDQHEGEGKSTITSTEQPTTNLGSVNEENANITSQQLASKAARRAAPYQPAPTRGGGTRGGSSGGRGGGRGSTRGGGGGRGGRGGGGGRGGRGGALSSPTFDKLSNTMDIDFDEDEEDEEDDEEDNDPSSPSHTAPSLPTLPRFADAASRVRYILSLQEFDGSFETSGPDALRKLAHALGVEAGVLATDPGVKGVDETVWATVCVVVFLEGSGEMKGEKEVWEMSVGKAREWLEGSGVDLDAVGKRAEGMLGI